MALRASLLLTQCTLVSLTTTEICPSPPSGSLSTPPYMRTYTPPASTAVIAVAVICAFQTATSDVLRRWARSCVFHLTSRCGAPGRGWRLTCHPWFLSPTSLPITAAPSQLSITQVQICQYILQLLAHPTPHTSKLSPIQEHAHTLNQRCTVE